MGNDLVPGMHVIFREHVVEFRGYDDGSQDRAVIAYLDGEDAGKTAVVGTVDLEHA